MRTTTTRSVGTAIRASEYLDPTHFSGSNLIENLRTLANHALRKGSCCGSLSGPAEVS
ncbi:hypothetical protein ACJX0J_005392, partial [Zea mays]